MICYDENFSGLVWHLLKILLRPVGVRGVPSV